jgi:hypothetical protein
VCVCVSAVKHQDHECGGPPWIIFMITEIQSERHRACMYVITKNTKNDGRKELRATRIKILIIRSSVSSTSSSATRTSRLVLSVPVRVAAAISLRDDERVLRPSASFAPVGELEPKHHSSRDRNPSPYFPALPKLANCGHVFTFLKIHASTDTYRVAQVCSRAAREPSPNGTFQFGSQLLRSNSRRTTFPRVETCLRYQTRVAP